MKERLSGRWSKLSFLTLDCISDSFSLNFCLLLSHRSQMNAGLCVCVVLAVLCASCLGLPFSSQPLDEGQRPISALSEGKSCDTFLAITVSFCA